MSDPHDFLKASGYLDSPAQRFLWLGASPTFRNHLRQWSLLTLFAGVPISLLMSVLTNLRGSDRPLLFLVTLTGIACFSVVFDLILGLLVRLPALEPLWTKNRRLNLLPLLLGTLFLVISGLGFGPLLQSFDLIERIAYWLALVLTAFCAATSFHMLLITRLYWHGIQPASYKTHTWLTIAALCVTGLIIALSPQQHVATHRLVARDAPPILILAMDIPPAQRYLYSDVFAAMSQQSFRVAERDLVNFWVSVGTGMKPEEHRSSLVLAKTDLFKGGLSRNDPTVTLPLMIFDALSLTRPMAAGHRFKFYAWEILAKQDVETMSLGYWLTYPATDSAGHVLSERWQPELSDTPYSHGLQVLKTDPLPLNSPGFVRDTLAREKQIWAQLQTAANQATKAFTIAYLPMADLLDDDLNQQKLAIFRKNQLNALLGTLPADTCVAFLISSGKDGTRLASLNVELYGNTAWQTGLPKLESPYQLASTVLNYFGFPADKKMIPSALDSAENTSLSTHDYGERKPPRHLNQQQNLKYYRDLKALGYIQ